MAEHSPLVAAVDDLKRRLERTDWTTQSPSRRQILEVFLALALEHGINSVSMRMIAHVIGIKAPSIYAHFPAGRNEIVAEASRWHFYKFGTAVLTEIAPCTTASETWSAMVKVHLIRQITLPESNLWDLLIATDRMVHALPSEVRAEADELVVLYENLYRAAAFEMGFPTPDEGVRITMTLLEGASRWCQAEDSQSNLPDMINRADELTRMVLQATSSTSALPFTVLFSH